MVLTYFGVNPQIAQGLQLEDWLYNDLKEKGKEKTLHSHLSQTIQEFGVKNVFSTTATWQQVKDHLSKGFPVIISGNFTRSGHIIVLRGFDDKGFYINDSFGEVLGKTYKYANKSGDNLHYSYNLCEWACSQLAGSGKVWAHFPEKENFTAKVTPKKKEVKYLRLEKDTKNGIYYEVTNKRRIFLDLIAWCEGTDNNLDTVATGYNILFGYQTFDDFRSHPKKVIRSGGYASSAAGRYQIMDFTEDDLRATHPNMPDFSPQYQDQRCLALIKRRKALDDVDRLDLMGFLKACSKEWASLPFSPYGQPIKTLNSVKQAFNRLKKL